MAKGASECGFDKDVFLKLQERVVEIDKKNCGYNSNDFGKVQEDIRDLRESRAKKRGIWIALEILLGIIGVSGIGSLVWSSLNVAGFDKRVEEGVARVSAVSSSAPVGAMAPYSGPQTEHAKKVLRDQGWLFCDGSPVSRKDYDALFAVIETAYGEGDGKLTFNLPDVRGRFLRGVDGGIGRDEDAKDRLISAPGGNKGDNVGSLQGHATAGPTNSFITSDDGTPRQYVEGSREAGGGKYFTCSGIPHTITDPPSTSGGAHHHYIGSDRSRFGGDTETRPENIYVNWIIRAKR